MASAQRWHGVSVFLANLRAIVSSTLNSLAQIYENIPWLSRYTKYIPGASSDLKRFRMMAFGRTEERYKSGSKSKDLFYYLVRPSYCHGFPTVLI